MRNAVISDTHKKPINSLLPVEPMAVARYMDSRHDIQRWFLDGDIVGLWTGKSFADKERIWTRLKRRNPEWFEWLQCNCQSGRVVYIAGNHDQALLTDDLFHPVYDSFDYDDHGRRVHLEHGHAADWFNSDGRIVGRILTYIGGWISRLPGVNKERLWRAGSRLFTPGRIQSAERFRAYWLNEARVNGWDTIVTGHTHQEEICATADGRVFANAGTWINRFMLPMIVIEDGLPELEYVSMEAMSNDAD